MARPSDTRVQGRGPEGAGGWLESACKLVVNFRTGVLVLTMLSLPDEERVTLVVAALLVTGLASFIVLRYWDRIGPALVRHPAYLAGELVLATLVLVLTGVESPFFYYTVGTALLGGLLYGWAGATVFSAMLFGVYFWVLSVWTDVDDAAETFQTYAGLPALYFIAGAAGAGARRLLDRQATAEADLATEHERARLAREMHDSLAKTVHGIAFAALGLSRQIEREPGAAAAQARKLADDARQAAHEARELLTGLRGQDGAPVPVATSLRAEAHRWSAATGIRIGVDLQDVGELSSVAARELEAVCKEALRNIERHAHASNVAVHLRTFGERAVLTIRDDGDGFEMPDDLDELAAGRHFGIKGMRERALLAGGDLSVESEPGEGCVISAWVPAESPAPEVQPPAPPAPPPQAPPPPREPEPTSGEPASVPDRAVPGFTWQ